jgi:hypothetical protein
MRLKKGQLPSLSVTNDQFTLSTANWHQRIDGLDTGLHGLSHRNTWNDAGSLDTDTETGLGVQWSFAIDGVTQSVNDTAQDLLADWHVDNGAGTLDNVAFLDQLVVTEYYNTDVVGLQIEGHTLSKGKKRVIASSPKIRRVYRYPYLQSG